MTASGQELSLAKDRSVQAQPRLWRPALDGGPMTRRCGGFTSPASSLPATRPAPQWLIDSCVVAAS